MNKYLTGVVAMAAVGAIATTSIPASAEVVNDFEQVKSIITNAMNRLTSIGEDTTGADIKALYSNKLEGSVYNTNVDIEYTTPSAATININVTATTESAVTVDVTTPEEVTIETLSFNKPVTNEGLVTLPTDETTTGPAVTVGQAKDKINDAFKNLKLYNNAQVYDVYEAVKGAIYDTDFYGDIHNFTITPAINNKDGLVTGIIELTDNNEALIEKMPFSIVVSKGINPEDDNDNNNYDERYDKLYDELDNLQDAINKLKVSNDTTVDDIIDYTNKSLKDKSLELTISNFYRNPSEGGRQGNISFSMNLVDPSNNLNLNNYEGIDIDTPSSAEIKELINNYLAKLQPSNNMNENDILNGLNKVIEGKVSSVRITDFYLMKATNVETDYSDGKGICNFHIELKDLNENWLGIDYYNDKIVYTEEPGNTGSEGGSGSAGGSGSTGNSGNTGSNGNSGSSSGSSSSHHSSGSNSSSSSSSSSSSNIATGSTTNTSNTGASTGAVSDSTKPVSLANMSKEAVKAVEASVVNNISTVIGATAEQAKEVVAADGTKLSVTAITKDGKSVGAVITAEAGSTRAVIPVDKAQAPVAAVYKYVPLLGKYIQVQDAVITADAVTLPVQANATYVASPVVMTTADTIKEGWVQVSNNWYMVNGTGDPLTGWQKDSVGWTYMSPSNGAMQTGWSQLGGTWYYLKNNGYMSTGWVKDGSTWYYCNSDGSMAANTEIDGYKLGANGAWIG